MFYKPNLAIPSKIPVYKSDGAPMLLFIDILKSKIFENPCLGTPLRIDKITNGQSTLFIFPKKQIFQEFNNQFYTLNLKKIFQFFVDNLIKYAKKKYNELCLRQLSDIHLIT